MTIKFKKDKEYFIKTNNRTFKYRVIVSKVVTEMIEKVLTQVAIVVNTTDGDNSKTIKLSDITMVIEPVSNIEIFQMWTNWNNANNPDCIFYNKAYANELRSKISKTLKERSYVMYGTGKLEAFDYKKMYEMRNDIKSENFKFNLSYFSNSLKKKTFFFRCAFFYYAQVHAHLIHNMDQL